MPVRTSNAVWRGDLKGGDGTVALGSGAFEGPYSFPSRFEEGPGTNPEELIGAAHAGCFAMALSGRPVPETMTGAVPPGLLAADPTRADYGDIAYATASAAVDGDDGAVTERLEDLGYL